MVFVVNSSQTKEEADIKSWKPLSKGNLEGEGLSSALRIREGATGGVILKRTWWVSVGLPSRKG